MHFWKMLSRPERFWILFVEGILQLEIFYVNYYELVYNYYSNTHPRQMLVKLYIWFQYPPSPNACEIVYMITIPTLAKCLWNCIYDYNVIRLKGLWAWCKLLLHECVPVSEKHLKCTPVFGTHECLIWRSFRMIGSYTIINQHATIEERQETLKTIKSTWRTAVPEINYVPKI